MPDSQMFAYSESRSPEVSPGGYIRHGMDQVFVRIGGVWVATTSIVQIELGDENGYFVMTATQSWRVKSLAEMWATATTRPGA